MKQVHSIFFSGILILLFGCKKEVGPELAAAANSSVASEITTLVSRLSYSDTVFYVKNEPGNYIIRPVRRPQVAGYFKAIPAGLVYDSIYGRINVTRSETGLRYKMYYLSPTGQKLDSTQFVISGIDYVDGIYDLSAGQDTAFPIYAANPGTPLPCDDDDDDDDGCIFDERDLDGNGSNDIPGANSRGFRVNRRNAVIDLYATIAAGALGANPQNGAKDNFLFYYRLNDNSSEALQDITVRLYYYNTVANIPPALINELNARKAQDEQVNSLAGSPLLTSNEPVAAGSVYARDRKSVV